MRLADARQGELSYHYWKRGGHNQDVDDVEKVQPKVSRRQIRYWKADDVERDANDETCD